MEPSIWPTLGLRGGFFRSHVVSGSDHQGVRVADDLDLSYVVSTSLSSLWGMRKQNMGLLDMGIQGTESMLLIVSNADGR